MDFGVNAPLTPSDYVGVDMTPIRELKRAHEATKVPPTSSADGGTIQRGQVSPEKDAKSLERAGQKLETAGRAVHQVEDLLHDTLTGFRTNRAADQPESANERLLRSADETANEIVSYVRYDEEMVFPPTSMPLRFEQKQALGAYAKQKKALKDQRSLEDLPVVSDVLQRTNEKLRGEGGVLPTLSVLSETGARDPEGTDETLSGLKDGMGVSRQEIDAARLKVTANGSGRIDVAS